MKETAMRTKILLGTCSVVAVTMLLGPAQGWAQRWDVRREVGEGAREVRREREEAVREIRNADSPWEVRHEIREGHRQITREKNEARRQVRREINQPGWRW
jgi:hypothetical protein